MAYSGGGRDLMRYDPATNLETRIASFPRDGKLRASSDPYLRTIMSGWIPPVV